MSVPATRSDSYPCERALAGRAEAAAELRGYARAAELALTASSLKPSERRGLAVVYAFRHLAGAHFEHIGFADTEDVLEALGIAYDAGPQEASL